MVEELTVHGALGAVAFGLGPGQTSYWVATGDIGGFGRMAWFVADPIFNASHPNASNLEVQHVTKATDNTNTRVAYFQVYNHGPDSTTYAIRWAITQPFS